MELAVDSDPEVAVIDGDDDGFPFADGFFGAGADAFEALGLDTSGVHGHFEVGDVADVAFFAACALDLEAAGPDFVGAGDGEEDSAVAL